MLDQLKTLTGIPLNEELWNALTFLYPARAYTSIKSKSYLSDVNNGFVSQRLYQVFGPRGLGWGMEYDTATDLYVEKLETSGGKTRWEATIDKGEFWYAYITPEGETLYQRITTAGGSKNSERGDAIKGAQTACIKKALSWLGHQNSLYRGDLSHQNASQIISEKGRDVDFIDPISGGKIAFKHAPSQQSASKGAGIVDTAKDLGGVEKNPEPTEENEFEADELRKLFIEKAGKRKGSPTPKQKSALSHWLEALFVDNPVEKRHGIMDYVWNEPSTMKLSDPQVLVTMDWLDLDKNGEPSARAKEQAKILWDAHVEKEIREADEIPF